MSLPFPSEACAGSASDRGVGFKSDGGAVEDLMTGQFHLGGDVQKVVAYSEAATLLTDLSAELEAQTVTERYG